MRKGRQQNIQRFWVGALKSFECLGKKNSTTIDNVCGEQVSKGTPTKYVY